MNINNEALYRFLTEIGSNIPIQYLKEDYNLVAEKARNFQKKKGEMPSITFLFRNVKKLSDEEEVQDRLEDILYTLEKHKPENISNNETAELLLEEYKKDKLRELTKQSATEIINENWIKAERLSKEIGEVSRLELNGDRFLQNDVKSDITEVSTVATLMNTGFFSDMNYSLSRCPVGSMILVIGSTGMGKTLLTLGAMVEGYLEGKNMIYISYEMPKQQVLARIKSYITKVPMGEIISDTYVTEEAEVLVKASEWVLKKEVTIDEAYTELVEDIDFQFEDYKDRKNYFKIVAAMDASNFKKKKASGEPIEELPNDLEIINMIQEYGESLDIIAIDLVSEIDFQDKYASTEAQMTGFGRELKAQCLMNSVNSIIVSQPENEKSAHALIYPKYAKSLRSSSDMSVILMSTKELIENNMIGVCVEKCRHNIPNRAYICEADYSTMTFTPTGEEESLWELMELVNKDMKKKGEEKK